MGRPYASEIAELNTTYAWCLNTPVDDLARSIERAACLDALMVGSGGSLTSAHFATFLHGHYTGRTAETITPFELASLPRGLDRSAVLIYSAGGSNPDVIGAAQLAIKRAPAQLIALTTRPGSPLERVLHEAIWPTCHVFATPTKKDGFLATNSLLATIVLLIRAYERCAGMSSLLPPSLDALLHPQSTRAQFLDSVRAESSSVLTRDTLVVLHGATTKPAAMDVESRFTEAALASVQPADFRNFAHGRHHWLARHAATTGVLAFATSGDDVARKTLALLPKSIPRLQVDVDSGVQGALAAVCNSLILALVAGECRGVDPGRPHVPTFGRKLYHLRAMPAPFGGAEPVVQRMHFAIERKSRISSSVLAARGELDLWIERYRAFVDRLATARLRALVVDYDGTLCGPSERLTGPSSLLIKRLNTLLDAGCTVAVATGRGRSVRESLLQHITTAERRRRVIVGYHNGAEIGSLADDHCPPPSSPLASSLLPVAEALRASATIARYATVEAKGRQISLELKNSGSIDAIYEETTCAVRAHATCGKVVIVTSSHSVDVLAEGVGKRNVVDHVVRELELPGDGADCLLCIGDRGRHPGNDAELLAHSLALTVDEASHAPHTCWSLADPSVRFERACLEYLGRLRPSRKGLRFDVKGVSP